MAKKFELQAAIWQGAGERLEVGAVVTFPDDEPTGIFIGRVKELVNAEAIEIGGEEETPKPPAPPRGR